MLQVTQSKTVPYIMGQNHVYISLGLFFLLLQSSPVKSDIQTLNICHEETVTSDRVYINMDTSFIAGQDGSCSCRVSFKQSTELVLSVHNLTSPHCATSVSLSGFDLNITCTDGYIQPGVYYIRFKNGNGFWIIVKTNGSSPEPMSGFFQLRAQHSTNFTFQCFESLTSQPSSTLTTTTTTSSSTTSPSSSSTTTTTTERTTTMRSSTSTMANQQMHSTTVESNVSAMSNTDRSETGPKELPVAAVVGGIVCVVGVVILIIVGVVFHRRYQCTRRPVEGSSTPESREHPTYSDLTNRENTYLSINPPAESAAMSDSEAHPTYSDLTNRGNTVYEHIDQGRQGNVYQNVAL